MLCMVNTFVNRSHKNDTKQLMDEDNNMLDADTVENIPPSTNTVTHKHLHKDLTTVLVNTHKCQKRDWEVGSSLK